MTPSHKHDHPPLPFWRRYIFSTDHKVIAIQYLFTGVLFLLLAGAFALIIRYQLAYPFTKIPLIGDWLYPESSGALPPDGYYSLLTMHGSLMVFFAVTPILIGSFGNFLIPLAIGAADMAFPVLNMLSYWTVVPAGAVMLGSFFMKGGAASAGWTAYPPLSSNPTLTVGDGQTWWVVGILLAGTSTLLGAINYIATILNLRCRGMHLMRMPLSVWGLFFTSVLNLLWIPVVAAALALLLMDRVAGTPFFSAGPLAPAGGGQPLLYQHLFWGFGHPEVYILILPVWGIVGDLLSVFSRKPAFGYRATVFSMAAITMVSQIVWGHHLYTSGMNPLLGKAFVFLTITISVPSAVFFLNWLGTLWGGSLRFTSPMLFSLGIVFVFALGGLTGLFNAVQTLDVYIHDTYFVVGHFHYTMAASVLFGAFAGIYYWFPKMFGREMNETLGKIHFWFSFIFLNGVFFSMMRLGLAGHMRRIADPTAYDFLKPLQHWNVIATWSALGLTLAQLPFVYNFVVSLVAGPKARVNPWEASTLEWTLVHPIPHGNFPVAPVVYRGPHEYSAPEILAATATSGEGRRDFITQDQPLPRPGGNVTEQDPS